MEWKDLGNGTVVLQELTREWRGVDQPSVLHLVLTLTALEGQGTPVGRSDHV